MSTPLTPEALVDSPRGRRLLLELAVRSEPELPDDADDDAHCATLAHAVFLESYHRDPGGGIALFGPGAAEARRTHVSGAEVARRIAAVPGGPLPDARVRAALAASVDSARYWQGPDGEDVLAADPAVRDALGVVAERLLAEASTATWERPVDPADQWSVRWEEDPHGGPTEPVPAREALDAWRREILAEERRAARGPETSGAWWSTPPTACRGTTSALPDGSPLGLRLIEDSVGFERATVRRCAVPPGAGVLEVTGPEDWVALCRRFPLEVTAQKGPDWRATTGRTGRWVMPDWSRVAAEVDGVHVTVAGYLTTATRALELGDGTACLLAGWDPDRTVWFTEAVRPEGPAVRWTWQDGDGPEGGTFVRG